MTCARRYSPENCGLRFSVNARTASLASSELRFTTWAAASASTASAKVTVNAWSRRCLVCAERDRCHLEQAVDDGVDRGVEVAGRHDPIDDADALGLGGVDHLGEERQLLGLVHADEAREQPRAAVVDAEPTLHEDGAEASGVGRDDEIAAEREVESRAGGHAVHLGDGGLADVAQGGRAPPDTAHVLESSARAAWHLLRDQVGTRTEALAGAGDHEHAVVTVCRDLVEDVAQVAPHRAGDRVELGGTVQRQRHHTVASFHEEVGHRPLP